MDMSVPRVNGLTIAYIGGGSRGWAWNFMKDLGLDPQMEGLVRLYDIDPDAAEKNRLATPFVTALVLIVSEIPDLRFWET